MATSVPDEGARTLDLSQSRRGAGYASRFSLVYIDYPTQRRIPKASFGWYRALIASARTRVMNV